MEAVGLSLSRSEQSVLDAHRDLERRGMPATADRIAVATGLGRRAVLDRARAIRKKGHGPLAFAPPRRNAARDGVPALEDLDEIDREILEAAGRLADEDGCVSPGLIVRTVKGAHESRIIRLRKWGLWNWPTPDPRNADGPDPEIMAAIRAGHLARMIDGRHERDETPPGVPCWSGKDHAVEARRKFHYQHFEGARNARVHKVTTPASRARSHW